MATLKLCICYVILLSINHAVAQDIAEDLIPELPSKVNLADSNEQITTTSHEAPVTTQPPTTQRRPSLRKVVTTSTTTKKTLEVLSAVTDTTKSPTPSKDTRIKNKPALPFQCPFDNGLFADPETCRRFYTCTVGHAISQNCPPGLYFDDNTKFCTMKQEATCGPVNYVTSTNAPLDETLVAKECDPAACQLPDCFCSSDGTQIPGGLSLEEVPQMVILSFTGGINLLNYPYFKDLLQSNRSNPNGCKILASFYVSHDYTNYHYVQSLYAMGNEIGVNSISNRKPEEYWSKGSYENWTMEMVGMREILETFAGIPKDDILGLRGPFTKTGGNDQFDMMNDFGFVYDATMTTFLTRVPSWPFSLDYKMPFKCRAGNCPSYTYPSIWELPINMLYTDDGEGGNCAFLDQCVFLYQDEETIFNWLMENYNRHYNSNRAPLGLNLQTSWFFNKERISALNRFIDTILAKGDSYFVTSAQALQWVIQPTSLANIGKIEPPWSCPAPRQPACNIPKTCAVPFSGKDIQGDVRYMQTCFSCPQRYPWVGNARGEDKEEIDVYTPDIHSERPAEV